MFLNFIGHGGGVSCELTAARTRSVQSKELAGKLWTIVANHRHDHISNYYFSMFCKIGCHDYSAVRYYMAMCASYPCVRPIHVCVYPCVRPIHVCVLSMCASYPCVRPIHVCVLSMCVSYPCVRPIHVCVLSMCASYPCVRPIHVCVLSMCVLSMCASYPGVHPIQVCATHD